MGPYLVYGPFGRLFKLSGCLRRTPAQGGNWVGPEPKLPISNYRKDGYNLAERVTTADEYEERWQALADIPGFELFPGMTTPSTSSAWSVEKSSIPKSFAIWKSRTRLKQNLRRTMHDSGLFRHWPFSLLYGSIAGTGCRT